MKIKGIIYFCPFMQKLREINIIVIESSSHLDNYGNLLSRNFVKNFVKATFLVLKKWLKNCFHEKKFGVREFRDFPHCCAVFTNLFKAFFCFVTEQFFSWKQHTNAHIIRSFHGIFAKSQILFLILKYYVHVNCKLILPQMKGRYSFV